MHRLIIVISILFLLIGIVAAADIADKFTAPNGLEKVGTNGFVDRQGHNINVFEYTEDTKDTWFTNDTDYFVQPFNDTCWIGVDDENDCYILEVVEKDDAKVLVSSWSANGPDETPIIQENLLEFNKLNHLTPLKLDEVLL